MKYEYLTTPQQNIWNLQKFYSGTAVSNLCGAVFYREKRDSAHLKEAVRLFIKSQTALRLRFCEQDGPRQYVENGDIGQIPILHFPSREEFDAYAEKFAREPLGLTNCPMYRFAVFEAEGQSGILILLSHLIADAWTCGLLLQQIERAYHQLQEGAEVSLQAGDYRDYIQRETDYLHSGRYEKDREYWEKKYENRPEESPVRPGTAPAGSITARRITRILSAALEQEIKAYCLENAVTQAVLFETALFVYLAGIHPGNRTVTIGLPVLNRSSREEKGIAGMFVTTMPFTVDVSGEMTVTELAGRITMGHMELYRHQKYPYARILKYLREKQNFTGNLYDVMLSCQNAESGADADTLWYGNGYSEVPLVIHIDNRDGKECHTVNVDYQTGVFSDEAEVVSLIDRLEYILGQIVTDPARPVKQIGIIPPAEWRKLIDTFNDTHMEYSRGECVHELFSRQAARTPDKTALVFENQEFTYRQLDGMSNSLAHFLREKGVGQNEVVPILAKRSWHVIVAMLGILKAGGAYIPVDPAYPQERIAEMIETAQSKLVLFYGVDETEKKCQVESVNLGNFDFENDQTEVGNINQSEDTCYVIFTSGSTGKPKGADISHRNLANFTEDNEKNLYQHYALENGKVMLACTVFSFDISVFEIFLSLLHGLCVVLAGEDELNSPERIAGLINENAVDVIHCTPTKIRMFLGSSAFRKAVRGVKVLMIGAEELTSETYHKISGCTDAAVFNGYGPTETTVGVAFKRITGDDITIGKPIANTQIYILSQTGAPCPIGVPGELCIAGEGVGKGYLNRPELTAEKFVPNPFANEENGHGRVMYRTGDLARFREDGEIEYLGRIDTQVKIRGLRIELGEIESVMSGFSGIGLAAAAAGKDSRGRQYLTGYYTSEEEIDEKELRRFLERKLPAYMVPHYFLHLAEMPMTPSGKTDRKNLPEPVFTEKEEEYAAPETDTEKKLSEIWAEILSADRVGRNWDFMECGGDSLGAIQMLARIEECFDKQVEISDIMKTRVLWKLASRIEEAPERQDRILAQNIRKYPLTPQQKAIYIAYKKEPDSLVYNMPLFLPLPEDADVETLEGRVLGCLKRHPALRTAVLEEEGEIFGIVREDVPLVFETYERREDFVRPFRLEEAPLMRVGIRSGEMALDLHHIACDGESLQLILQEILTGQQDLETVSYGDYAAYFYRKQKSGGFGGAEAYYRELFPEQPEPVSLPRTGKPGKGGAVFSWELAPETVGKVHDITKTYEATETCAYLSAYGLLLAGFSGRQDPVFSVILSNRMHTETRHTVGMFVNTLPMALRLSGEVTVTEYMEQTRQRLDSALRYQELPFLDACGAASIGDKSVFAAAFVYQPGEKRMREAKWESVHTNTSKMDLTFQVIPGADGSCRIEVEYDRELYDGTLMERLAKGYEEILRQIADGGKQSRISDIRVMGGEEYRRIILDFNRTAVPYQREKGLPKEKYLSKGKYFPKEKSLPWEKCIHELFSEQAARTPDKIALISGGESFTYRQLDEMSNSLAHFLREKGVAPGEIVPLIARRSYHAVAAMLGILKAGGAYMPVDPDYPKERIAYMLSEAASRIGVTYGYQGSVPIETVALEDFDFSGDRTPLPNVNSPEDTCYVIFTSGSMGKPKGADISHRNLANFTEDNEKNLYQHYALENGKVMLACTVFSFDISVFEIFLSLLHGLCVVLAGEDELNSPERIAGLINENAVDVIHCTPTKIRMFLGSSAFRKAVRGVKVLMIGAEELTSETYHKISGCTDAAVFNGYGPTETTVGVAFKRITGDDITIGKPIANTQIYILSQTGAPCPVGVPGELCIAGAGVGKGYLNRPELTAEKFMPNPFANEENGHGRVMYRTGDLARFREDGEIEYLGRMDTQVKIRGLRIELGEIESVMSGFPGIGLAAAAAGKDSQGRQYLAGYYTSEEEIDEKKLQKHLAQKLPRYMIPNCLMRLETMPMTSGGKTDRKNLPEPDFKAGETEYEAPVTETEKALARIWEKVLNLDQAGCKDDFFDCGGDSLTALVMLSEIEARFHIHTEMKEIFTHTVLRDLAVYLDGLDAKSSCIPKQNRGRYMLTPQQKAIYLACSKNPKSLVYNMPLFVKLPEGTDTEALRKRIREVYLLHPALRTAIKMEGKEAFGVQDENAELVFEEADCMETFVRPFDLGKAPLFRAAFFNGGMGLDVHHIVCDGDSMELLLGQIFGEELSEESVSYGDYADFFWQRLESGGFSEHAVYFKRLIDSAVASPALPEISSSRSGGNLFTAAVDHHVTKAAERYAADHGLTKTGLYFGAFGLLLAKYANQEDFVTSIILSNRGHFETSRTVGMFVNTIPYCFHVDLRLTWGEYAEALGERLTELYQYQELPFLEICDAVGIRDRSVVNTAFVYQPGEMRMAGLDVISYETHTCKLDLSFQVIPQPDGGNRILIEYNGEKYDEKLIGAMADSYIQILRQIGQEKRLGNISLLNEEEYEKVVLRFNDTNSGYPRGKGIPREKYLPKEKCFPKEKYLPKGKYYPKEKNLPWEKCIHELFSQQAARTPDKTALIGGGKSFTYRQLDEMSNSLAHFLREKGVAPGEIVPLIARRSYHAVAAMLGILKAGGAYMPVDPDYPAERIAYMLSEAASRIGVTYGYQGSVPIETVALEDFDFSGNRTPLPNVNSPEDTCYVIFTSGSTGKPKGALLKHSGLVNLCCDSQVFYDAVYSKCDCVLAIGAFTFDISISEMFPMLVHGGKIVLADEQDMSRGESLAALMTQNQVDLFCATPTRLRYYLEQEEFQNAVAGVKVILSAGEAFPPELYDKVRGCTDGEIYNGYGPTETTVGATFAKVKEPGGITVGRPMSNVQIYILSQTGAPCPVGVPGELCIAGAGVGKGYLNRPELTAEKFVPNPFANEENGHGRIMYRTGDLARFREDGEIEYLGRMDTQVKIRGLRIELGEIESMMSGFPGIGLAAAAAKKDSQGRQYLAGYYTSENPIDEKELREHLAQKLPRYMIPNCLMRLETMPMTSGGKTDRKNLPEPDFKAGETEYEEPVTETERVICEAMSGILEGRRTGRNDDFFEIGGDSLLAMMLATVLSDRGVAVSMQDIYEHPTPARLGRMADQKQTRHVEYSGAEFSKYEELLKSNKQSASGSFLMKRRTYGNVLLTGATGFLGAHLLEGLLRRGSGRVYCLVRDASKLKKTLAYYFGQEFAGKIGGEILPVEGDVTDADSLHTLPQDVETVIHAAALVKHYGEYAEFERVNVIGTKNMLAYTAKTGSRFILISTTSVGGAALTESGNKAVRFTEQDFYIGQNLDNVYVQSKFEAERLVLDAVAAGEKCRIFRVGNLTNRYRDGMFQPNFRDNAFLRRIRTFLDNGMIPDVLAEELVELTPVDLAAEAILALEESAGDEQTVFHIANLRKAVTYRQLAGLLGEAGVRVSLEDTEGFLRKLKADLNRENSSVINERNEMEAMSGRVRVQADTAFTDAMLSQAGFCWADISVEYLRKYVEFIRRQERDGKEEKKNQDA